MAKRKKQADKRAVGRPSTFRPEYIELARAFCELGAIDDDLARAFKVNPSTIDDWKMRYADFASALKAGKEPADERVTRSLYQRAIGYSYDAVKVFLDPETKMPIYAPYREHVHPDTTACIFWLKNRKPKEWRDVQDHRHQVVTKTEEQLRQEILADLEELGLFEEPGQIEAHGVVPHGEDDGNET